MICGKTTNMIPALPGKDPFNDILAFDVKIAKQLLSILSPCESVCNFGRAAASKHWV